MVDLRGILLPRLEGYRLPGLDAGPGAVYPHYAGYSLCNLPASVCQWLGVPPLSGAPALGGEIAGRLDQNYQHVILVLIDGLGLEQIEAVMDQEGDAGQDRFWTHLAAESLFAPLTSITPSTTAAALTTLWTGVPPSGHGVMGYEMWLKEYSMIINAITHAPVSFSSDPGSLRKAGFIPETFLPVPTLGPRLSQNGVLPFAYHPQSIFRSSLSTMLLPGVNNIPYRTLSDLWVTLEATLDRHSGERTYSYVYWGDLDELAHRYGPQDERIRLELSNFSRQFDRFLARLRASRRGRTLLLVTADHGQVFTPRQPDYDLRFHPQLTRCLTMVPSGEHRFAYLYLHPGAEQALKTYVEETWKDTFRLFPSNQALASGLFGNGEVYPRVAERTGDWIAIPQANAYWWWAEKENTMLGRHGGLSRAEMLVPLFALPLDS